MVGRFFPFTFTLLDDDCNYLLLCVVSELNLEIDAFGLVDDILFIII
jgi:hypothetical protein